MNFRNMNNPTLLRAQVYEYLREQIDTGGIKSKIIKISEICSAVNMSTSPVRDALIQLQTEGFVTLLPQRGVQINEMSLEDVRQLYEMLAGIESHILRLVFDQLDASRISRMKELNEEMNEANFKDDYNSYYTKNIEFHNVFVGMTHNDHIAHYSAIFKQRLFAFAKQDWGGRWKKSNYEEHLQLINLIEKGEKENAVAYLRDIHWKYNP